MLTGANTKENWTVLSCPGVLTVYHCVTLLVEASTSATLSWFALGLLLAFVFDLTLLPYSSLLWFAGHLNTVFICGFVVNYLPVYLKRLSRSRK